MAQEVREPTLSISKGYLEELDFGEAVWMVLAGLPVRQEMEKRWYSPLPRKELGIPKERLRILILMLQITSGKDMITYHEA